MEYNPETDNNVIKWWFVMPEEKWKLRKW
jgi:hypothetical protein